uniref:Uncharacterized protein n=1 Tax=Anguilla anguilla TaxID=7936 RepID=A0A0E9VDX4_ANGAN
MLQRYGRGGEDVELRRGGYLSAPGSSGWCGVGNGAAGEALR